ncbi:uncharacterized protein [Lepeophtheirus salmonis]|uniref:uncharacterized protein n=1 Tax=Lepeophtheirus salmonis TaxID=72036 RepID=UPI001AE3CE04|nr:uncharacterized threonine-rich GPI-anchored glycoprotein PJ4664.02-like [Lepeophtheirus salmonis]
MRLLHFYLLLLLMNLFWEVQGIWDLFFPSPKPSRATPKWKPTYSKPLPFKPSNRFQDSSNLLPLAKLFNLDVTSPRSVSTKPHFGPPRSFSDIFTGSNQIQSDYVLVRSPVSPSPSTVNPIPLREFSSSSSARYPKTTTTSMSRYSQTNPSNMTPTTTTTVYPKPTTTKNIQTTPSTTPTTTTTIVFSTSSSTLSPKLIISPSSQSTKRFEFSFVTPVSNIDSKAHISHSTKSTTPAVERRSSTPKRALSFITNPSTTRTTTVFLPTSTAAPIKRSFVTPSEIDIISSNYKPPRVEIKSAIINSQGIPLHAKVQLAESSTRDPPSHSSTSTTACTTTTVTTSTSNPSSTRTTTPLNSLAFVTPLLNEIKSYVTKSQKKYKKPFFVTPSSSTSTKSKSTPPNKYRQYTIRSSRVTAPFSLLRGRDNIRKEDVTTTRSSFQNRRRVRKLSSDSSTRTPRNNFSASTTIRSFEDLIITKKTPSYRSSDRKRPKSYYRRFKVRNTPSTTTNSFTVRRTRVNSRYPSSTNDSFTNNTHDDIDRIFHEIDPKVKNFILKPFDILTKPIKNVVDTFILKKKKKKWPKYIGVSHSSTFSPSPIDSALMSSTTLRPSVNVLPSYVSTPLNSFEQLIPSHSHIPDLVEIPPSSQVELPSYSSSTTTTTTKNPFLRTPKPSRKPKYEYNPSSSFTTTTKKPTIKKPIKAFINLGSNHAKQPSFHENRPTELKPSSNIKQNKDNFVYLHYPVTQVPTYYSSEASYTINPKTRKPYVTISRDPVLLFTTKPTTIPSSTSFISNGHGHYLIPSTTHTPVTPLINVNPNAVTVGTYGKPQKNFNRNDHSVDNVVKRPSSILSDEYGVPEAPIITDFQPLNENGDFLLNYKSIQRNKPDIVPVSLGDEYGIPEAPLVTNIEPIQQGGSFFTNYRPIQRNKPKESLVSFGADEYGVPEAPLVTNIETIEQKGFFSTNYRPIQRDKPKKPLISLDTNKYGVPEAPLVTNIEPIQPDGSFFTNYKSLTRNQLNPSRTKEIPRIRHLTTVNPVSTTPQTIEIHPYNTDKSKYSFSFGNSDSGGTVQQTVNLLINLLLEGKNQNQETNFKEPSSIPTSLDSLNTSGEISGYVRPLGVESSSPNNAYTPTIINDKKAQSSSNSVPLQYHHSFENADESVVVQKNYVPSNVRIITQSPPSNEVSNIVGYITPPPNSTNSKSKHLSKASSGNDKYSLTKNVIQTQSKVVQQTQPSTSYINPITTNYSTLPKTQKVIPDQLPTLNNDYSPLPSEKDSPEQVHPQPLPSLDSYNPPIKVNEVPPSLKNRETLSPKSIPDPLYNPPIDVNDKEFSSHSNKETQNVSNVQPHGNGNYNPSLNPTISPKNIGNQYHSPDQFNKVSTINPHLLPSLDYTPSNNLFDKEPSNPGPSEGYRPPSNNNHNQIQNPVVPNKAQLPKLPYQSSILEYQPPNPSKKLDKPLNPKDFKTSSKNNRGHDNNASSVSYSPPNDDLKSIHQYKSKKTSYSTTPKSINPSFDQSTYNKDVHRTDPQSDIDRPKDHNYSKKNLSPDNNSKNYSINHRDPLNNAPISEERLIPKYSSNGSSLETQENKYYEHNAGSNEFNESSTSRSTKVFHKYNSKHHLMDDKIPNIALGEEYRPASMTEHRSTSLKPKFNENGGRIHYHRRKNKPKGKRPYASKNGNRTPKQQHYSNNRSLSKEQQERQSLSSHGRNGQYQQKATTQNPKQLPQTRYPTRYPKYTTANSHVTKSYVRPISNIRSTTSSSQKPPIIYPSKTYKDKSILKSLPPRTHASDIDYDSEDVYFDYYYDDARDLNLNIQKSTPIHIVRRPSPRPPNYAISKRPTPKSVLVVNKPNYSSPSYQAPPPSQYQRAKPSFPNKKLNYHPHKAFSSSSEVLPELHGLLRPDNWDVKDFQGWEAYFSKGYDPKNAPRFPPGERTTMTESSNNFHGIGIGFNDWIKESEVESFGEGFPEHGEFSDIFGRDFAAKRMDSSETSFVPRTGLYYSKFEVSPQDQEVLEPFVQKVYNKDHQTHLLKELLNPLQEAVLQLSLN